MATRRMFSKTVTESDEFLSLPPSAQALYLHIGMNTDDDGYCEKLRVMRLSLGCQDDLQRLQGDRFIYIFENKVLLDLFFDENNSIRKDRKKESKYTKLYPPSTICQPDVNQKTAQVRLGKVSIGKKEKEKEKEKTMSGEKKPDDISLASQIILMFNQMNNKKKDVNNVSHMDRINKIIKVYEKKKISDEQILEKFRYVFKNQKKIHDDQNHSWNHYDLATLIWKDNFFRYVDNEPHIAKEVIGNSAVNDNSPRVPYFKPERNPTPAEIEESRKLAKKEMRKVNEMLNNQTDKQPNKDPKAVNHNRKRLADIVKNVELPTMTDQQVNDRRQLLQKQAEQLKTKQELRYENK